MTAASSSGAAPAAGSPMDDDLYRRLADLAAARHAETGPADASLRAQAEQVLYHEARLLDDRHFEEWMARFCDDGIYWVPVDLDGDPRTQVSYYLDDTRRLGDRIGLLDTGWAHAQVPPSRTTRVVSNVEAWPMENGDTFVRCSVVTWEFRRERLTPFVSRNDYVFASLGPQWRIRVRVVGLVNADGDVPKFAFIL